jgi:RNA polymerase sigma factor for flagellar operon FliA
MEHMPLARYLVGRVLHQVPPHIDPQDLMSAAVIGLINAADRYEASRGVLFRTFAERHVRGAIIDELRSHDALSRSLREKYKRLEREVALLEQRLGRSPDGEEIAAALSMTLDEYYELLEDVQLFTSISLDDNWEDDEGNLLCLADVLRGPEEDSPQRQVMMMQVTSLLGDAIDALPEKERLAVTLYYHEEMNLKEVGATLGLTESRISQLLSQAMVRLRGRLKRHQG